MDKRLSKGIIAMATLELAYIVKAQKMLDELASRDEDNGSAVTILFCGIKDRYQTLIFYKDYLALVGTKQAKKMCKDIDHMIKDNESVLQEIIKTGDDEYGFDGFWTLDWLIDHTDIREDK